MIGQFLPEELQCYPPRIVCRFFPEQGAVSCTTCTLSLLGFDQPVSVDMALLTPQRSVDTKQLKVSHSTNINVRYRVEGNFRVVQIFRPKKYNNTKIKTGINSHALVISHAKLLVGVVSWHWTANIRTHENFCWGLWSQIAKISRENFLLYPMFCIPVYVYILWLCTVYCILDTQDLRPYCAYVCVQSTMHACDCRKPLKYWGEQLVRWPPHSLALLWRLYCH